MKITNRTKKILLSEDVREAKTYLDKTVGLINPKIPRTLILKTKFGIHTLGMKENIDVIILNSSGVVVKLKHNLLKNSIFLWNPRYDTVIELPSGTLARTRTEIGDIIVVSSK